eukprot:1157685-Pelagomonas_calceolata.AAC.5
MHVEVLAHDRQLTHTSRASYPTPHQNFRALICIHKCLLTTGNSPTQPHDPYIPHSYLSSKRMVLLV